MIDEELLVWGVDFKSLFNGLSVDFYYELRERVVSSGFYSYLISVKIRSRWNLSAYGRNKSC